MSLKVVINQEDFNDFSPSGSHILINSPSILLGCLGIGVANAGGVDGAIARRINTSIDVIHSEQRVYFFHF